MKKLILHIGTEKTGTTSLQRWGAANRGPLQAQGVIYSGALGDANHMKIFLSVLRETAWDDLFELYGVSGQDQRKAFVEQTRQALAEEVARTESKGAHTFVISNEHCHSRLVAPEEVQALHDMLRPHFDEIEVVCFLRPQIEMAVSLVSTAVRVGKIIDRSFFDRLSEQIGYYNFETLIQRWATVFGQDALTVVPFKRNPDTVGYFIDRLGVNPETLSIPPRSNEALDVHVLALSNTLLRTLAEQGLGAEARPNLFLDALPFREKLALDRPFAETIQDRFVPSNARLMQEFACMAEFQPDDLTPDWSRYGETTNLDVLDRDAGNGAHLLALLQTYEQRTDLLRARERAASAERAIALDNPAAAKSFVRQARSYLAPLRDRADLKDDIDRLQDRLKRVMHVVNTDK